MRNIVLIIHNVRSCHNVGSMLRSAEGLGVNAVYLTGYTPYPQLTPDTRLPHEARKIDKQIHKTALDAEKYVTWYKEQDIFNVIDRLKKLGFTIAALEQTESSIPMHTYKESGDLALIVGREVDGVEKEVIEASDITLEIPMTGKKESFNVSVAAAMAIYSLIFANKV